MKSVSRHLKGVLELNKRCEVRSRSLGTVVCVSVRVISPRAVSIVMLGTTVLLYPLKKTHTHPDLILILTPKQVLGLIFLEHSHNS